MENCQLSFKCKLWCRKRNYLNSEVLKFDLCDYKDACILVWGDITIVGDNETKAEFKNCTPFIKHITKIDGTSIDDAENAGLVMCDV